MKHAVGYYPVVYDGDAEDLLSVRPGQVVQFQYSCGDGATPDGMEGSASIRFEVPAAVGTREIDAAEPKATPVKQPIDAKVQNPPATKVGQVSKKTSDKSWLPVTLTIAAALLLVLILGFLYWRNRKRSL